MTSTSGTKRVTPQHLILFRQTLGLTQSEAARMLDVTRVTWNRWENGRTHPPDFLLKVMQVAIQTWKREQTKQALADADIRNTASGRTDHSVRKARTAIRKLLLSGRPLKVAWSAGKDSWALLNLVLTTAREVSQDFRCPPLLITHADPLVDNPEITAHARSGIREIEAYASRHNLPVSIFVSKPYLNDEFAVKVIGGRALPVFPGQSHDCTIDWKTAPQSRMVKKILKALKEQGLQDPVTLIGTRYAESTARSANMEKRRETADEIWTGEKGADYLSPIADWQDSDVWRYLGDVRAGAEEGVSSMNGLFRLYRDGSSEIRTENGCEVFGCRFGCHCCTIGKDKSMESLLTKNPERYGYMEGLNRLQKFLVNTQYDFSRRQWIGRTMTEHGYIAIQPDIYSPAMLEELLRYAMTLDVREIEAADRLGISPRFQIVSARALIAIDAMWSLQGTHPAHHALKIFRDIYHDGKRYDIPDVTPFRKQPMPKVRYLPVGMGWTSGFDFSGLRDASLETVSFDVEQSHCMGVRALPDGRTVMDVRRGPFLDVDEESAGFVLGMELDYLLRNYGDDKRHRTSAYRDYVSTGILQLESKQAGVVDAILKRTAYKESMGLTDDGTDLDSLLRQTISAEQMKERISRSELWG